MLDKLISLIGNKTPIICGSTASGKSRFALELAKYMNAVIVNADSMQIYQRIPIITNQPTEKNNITHLLYNFIDPFIEERRFSVFEWSDEVLKIISNNKSIIVGGTGLYISSILDNQISYIPHIKEEIRKQLLYHESNVIDLYNTLLSLDNKTALRLNKNDKQRIIRALEVYYSTGIPLSEWHDDKNNQQKYNGKFFIIYILTDRKILYERINERFLEMISNGALVEAEECSKQNYYPKAIGLQQLVEYIKGYLSLEEAIVKGQQLTRNYAKRQMTWFNNKIKPDLIINNDLNI